MKLKRIFIPLLLLLLVASCLCITACNGNADILDGKYLVRFVFNGGRLSVGTTSVDDSSSFGYAYEELNTLILDPVAKYSRPNTTDAISKSGFVFTGWYKDEKCTQKWDFARDRLNTETLTLYAGWETAVKHTYSVCYMEDGQRHVLGTYNLTSAQIANGAKFQDYRNFANGRRGYTSLGLYYSDPECTKLWDNDYTHAGGDTDLDISVYVKLIEGDWQIVKNFDDLNKALDDNLNLINNVYLLDDIDCGGRELYFGDFNGLFYGKGHSISNFVVSGTRRISLFSNLGEKAEIQEVTFEKATYLIDNQEVPSFELAVISQKAEIGAKVSDVSVSGVVECMRENVNLENLIGENPVYIYQDSGATLSNVTCALTEKVTEE